MFLTPDPVINNAHDGQAYNPYSYVRNDPVNTTDPTGFIYEDGHSPGSQEWWNSSEQASFDEFVGAGDAYYEGGSHGLAQHELGALEREEKGYYSHVRADQDEANEKAEQARADADAAEAASAEKSDETGSVDDTAWEAANATAVDSEPATDPVPGATGADNTGCGSLDDPYCDDNTGCGSLDDPYCDPADEGAASPTQGVPNPLFDDFPPVSEQGETTPLPGTDVAVTLLRTDVSAKTKGAEGSSVLVSYFNKGGTAVNIDLITVYANGREVSHCKAVVAQPHASGLCGAASGGTYDAYSADAYYSNPTTGALGKTWFTQYREGRNPFDLIGDDD